MPNKQQSVLIGAAVTTVLSTSYLGLINCLCCAGIIAGAMVAVWHYTDTNNLTITAGNGAMIGVMTAVIGTLISLVLDYIFIKMGVRADLAITNFIVNSFGDQMPPDQLDAMLEAAEAEITIARHFGGGMIGVLISAIFGAIGGAIGASVFKKGEDVS